MLRIGDRLDEFEILESLGEGGMGQVYLARDTALKRQVAVKVISESLATDPAALGRFQREAELLAAVGHPNIATIYRVAIAQLDGRTVHYLVLERVEGKTLAARLQSGPLPGDEAVRIASQIARALQAAHRRGVIHRDLKPANVMLTSRGRVKVLDFGVAKTMRPLGGYEAIDETPTRVDVTATGTVVGTAPYMSPEQVRGTEIDARADVWAFGCVLYEMLAGSRAFAGATAADVMSAVLEREPDFSTLPAQTPESVRSLLRRCLCKDRERRLRDIGDARLELEDAMQEATGQREPVIQGADRSRLWPALGTVAGLVALVSIALAANVGGLRDRLTGDDGPGDLSAVTSTVVLPATVEGPEDIFTVGLHRLITDYLVNSGEVNVKLPPTQVQIDQFGGEYARIARAYEGVDAFVVPAVAVGETSTRFDLSLVQPQTRVVLWTGHVSGTPDHYEEMARQAAHSLMAALRPGTAAPSRATAARATNAVAAVQLRAGQDYSKRYNYTHEDRYYNNARQALDRALELDPELAEAAAERGLLEVFRFEHKQEASLLEDVMGWSRQARRLDPRSSLGWVLLAAVALNDDSDPIDAVPASLKASLKGVVFDSRSSIAHLAISMTLQSVAVRLGHLATERAIDLDPAYLYPLANAGMQLIVVDRSVEALRYLDRALAIEPEFPFARRVRVLALTDIGRLDEAAAELEWLEQTEQEGVFAAGPDAAVHRLVTALQRDDADVGDAYDHLLQMLVDGAATGEYLAVSVSALVAAERLDQALTLLERSYAAPAMSYDFWWLRSDLEPLRSDPRFARAAEPAGEYFASLRQVIETARAAGEFPDYLEEPYRDLIEQLQMAGRSRAGVGVVAAMVRN